MFWDNEFFYVSSGLLLAGYGKDFLNGDQKCCSIQLWSLWSYRCFYTLWFSPIWDNQKILQLQFQRCNREGCYIFWHIMDQMRNLFRKTVYRLKQLLRIKGPRFPVIWGTFLTWTCGFFLNLILHTQLPSNLLTFHKRFISQNKKKSGETIGGLKQH